MHRCPKYRSGFKRSVRLGAALISALAAAVSTAVAAEPRDTLERYARDTWASFVAMTDEENAVPSSGLYETLRTFVWFT
jgi:hypothetical protein